jgi:flagellar hook-associated protein 1 FlgK
LTPNPVNGVQGQSQTVSIPNSTLGGTQSIDFSQYGISINVSNPSNYVNTGVIGLYSGQAIGNQSVTSVSASGTLANGGYQIVTNTGSALPAGEIALEKPDGTYTSPITVAAGSSGGQLLNFGDGIKIELADNGAGDSASTIANSLNGTTFTVGMHAGSVLTNGETIQNINANTSAQPGTYQLSTDNNGNLTLTANINGSSVSQTIALSNLAANSSQSIDFNNLGISFAINNGSTQLSAQQLAQDLVGSSPTNQLVIAPGIDTGLDLATSLGQSGQNTIDVTGQTNAALAYGLTANNFVSLAPSDPAQYMNGTTPYISSAAANAVSAMGSVFGDAVSNMTSDVGSQIATWKNDQTANTAVLNNLQSQNDSISGVNLDEEAANLLKYQQLYSASSKVLQAGNDMFTALIGIMS